MPEVTALLTPASLKRLSAPLGEDELGQLGQQQQQQHPEGPFFLPIPPHTNILSGSSASTSCTVTAASGEGGALSERGSWLPALSSSLLQVGQVQLEQARPATPASAQQVHKGYLLETLRAGRQVGRASRRLVMIS